MKPAQRNLLAGAARTIQTTEHKIEDDTNEKKFLKFLKKERQNERKEQPCNNGYIKFSSDYFALYFTGWEKIPNFLKKQKDKTEDDIIEIDKFYKAKRKAWDAVRTKFNVKAQDEYKKKRDATPKGEKVKSISMFLHQKWYGNLTKNQKTEITKYKKAKKAKMIQREKDRIAAREEKKRAKKEDDDEDEDNGDEEDTGEDDDEDEDDTDGDE